MVESPLELPDLLLVVAQHGFFGFLGGWVGGWVGGWEEEIKAVGMRCGGLGMGGWKRRRRRRRRLSELFSCR